MYVLYEHASGYGLFAVKEFEEISMLHSEVEKSVTEFGKFASLIKLHAFSPFKSGANALDNINSISEGNSSGHQGPKIFGLILWVLSLQIVKYLIWSRLWWFQQVPDSKLGIGTAALLLTPLRRV